MSRYDDYDFHELLMLDGEFISFKDADLITSSTNPYISDWDQEEALGYSEYDILTLYLENEKYSDGYKISMVVHDGI